MASGNGNGNRRVLRLYIDVEPANLEERRKRLVDQQKALATARQLSPRPKSVVTIVIGPTELPCDLDLLQRATKFFVRGKPGMAYGLPACHVSLESFITIYKWMARPSQVVPPKLLMGVYRAAIYLNIKVLLEQFNEKFRDPRTAREEIGFYMFCGLHAMNLYVPVRKILSVNRFFLTMIGTSEYLHLWPNVLVKLLSSTNICVNSEMEVLIATVLWLFHDYRSRHTHTMELLDCVRFDSIPFEALLQFRDHCPLSPLTQLLFRPEFEMFLKRAPSLNNNIRYCNRRIWIYDPQCQYHHDAHCPRRNFITLDQFMDFQRVLRAAPSLHWCNRHQLNPYMHSCRHEVCRRFPKLGNPRRLASN
ncbi:uncharacterized protein LOC117785344 [Drosophila innubila]|uniref:uncharacterized protein LOC117785344 n=1 Tax=Drosophila innubila TaxID=198719 RepID=UPI00148BBB02|nr:uncharacterized protein LOC117785344 [Drosophila innubila]